MDSSHPETDRPGKSAERFDRQPKFDFAKDRANQRIAWANLDRIEAGLERIAEGIQIAEGSDLRAREYLAELERQEPELEQEAGRSQSEIEVAGSIENAKQQGRRSDNQPRKSDYQRKQHDAGFEL